LIKDFVLLAIAGAVGTLSRYGVSYAIQKSCGGMFPWGTVAVNMIGCFLFGMIWVLAETRIAISPQLRIILLTGFMGAFTTFSTFAFETAWLLQNSQWSLAAGNSLGQLIAGVSFVVLGMMVGRLF
jgi:CrcB protein